MRCYLGIDIMKQEAIVKHFIGIKSCRKDCERVPQPKQEKHSTCYACMAILWTKLRVHGGARGRTDQKKGYWKIIQMVGFVYGQIYYKKEYIHWHEDKRGLAKFQKATESH